MELREKLLRRVTYASVATASILVGLKTAVWLISDSVSILASLVDSLMDSMASLINFVAVRIALKPADDDHAFGHGKAEGLSALAQACFIAGSAVFLLMQALERFINPRPILHSDWGMAVMVVSIVMTLALVLYQRHVLKLTHSQAVAADSLHYVTDLLSNAVVLIALGLAAYGWQRADSVLAFLLGLWILKSAWDIAYDAVNTLMDKALEPEVLAQIETAALSVEGVLGIHDLRTRQSGGSYFIQMHVDMSEHLTLVEAHQIGDAASAAVRTLFAHAEIIAHLDPAKKPNVE